MPLSERHLAISHLAANHCLPSVERRRFSAVDDLLDGDFDALAIDRVLQKRCQHDPSKVSSLRLTGISDRNTSSVCKSQA